MLHVSELSKEYPTPRGPLRVLSDVSFDLKPGVSIGTVPEAHPVIAEGIGMAMQSAWLLCECLTSGPVDVLSGHGVDAVRRAYAAAWRRTLAPRIHAAALIAHWAMRPAAVACVLPLLRLFPGVLTAGARLSGKATSANRPLPVHSLTS